MLKHKILRGYSLLFAVCCWLCGCATAPAPQQAGFAGYRLNSTTYYPLTPLCDARNISWQYDTFTRAVTLARDAHRIHLRVGDSLVLVDGRPWQAGAPVEMYRGAVAVPEKFKQQVLDILFKLAPAAPKPATCVLRIRKVVIDPGHGGNDPGATGRSGLREKDVNLDIAMRLATILRQQGMEVVMTRASDRFIPLSRRAAIANNACADLFVSIHSNANRVKSLSGFEVYYVSPAVSDSKRAYEAARTCRLNLPGSSFAGNSLDLRATLWDMIYTYSRAESIELCRSLLSAMDANLDARTIGIKSAKYEVLRGVQMPGVLIEVGFLSNSKEETMLKNGFYRQKIADSIAEGIRDYAQTLPFREVTKR